MVYVTFSQQWAKKMHKDRVMRLWRLVITRPTPDLWLKVFFNRDHPWEAPLRTEKEIEKATLFFCGDALGTIRKMHWWNNGNCRGHYRCALLHGHGFYEKEWRYMRKNEKIKHCITLRIGESASDRQIAWLMAHEFRHYLQWKKYGPTKMNPKMNENGRRPIQVERDANQWAEKRIRDIFNSK